MCVDQSGRMRLGESRALGRRCSLDAEQRGTVSSCLYDACVYVSVCVRLRPSRWYDKRYEEIQEHQITRAHGILSSCVRLCACVRMISLRAGICNFVCVSCAFRTCARA